MALQRVCICFCICKSTIDTILRCACCLDPTAIKWVGSHQRIYGRHWEKAKRRFVSRNFPSRFLSNISCPVLYFSSFVAKANSYIFCSNLAWVDFARWQILELCKKGIKYWVKVLFVCLHRGHGKWSYQDENYRRDLALAIAIGTTRLFFQIQWSCIACQSERDQPPFVGKHFNAFSIVLLMLVITMR